MEHNKKITRQGSVSLPASLRREYGIEPGEKVAINVDTDGTIQIKRVEGSCVFCQNDQVLKKYNGRYICQECLQRLGGLQ